MKPAKLSAKLSLGRLRTYLAEALGVEPSRKEDLYIELSRGSTMFDLVYWLQILFSAGIATLGLVLDSAAVIIGAMLISPLMGPILAGGLALASGDLVLGIRSIAKTSLSALAAVLFSVLLVILLPFRELTGEIAARTEPNTLDLVIALFSGAVGSIAICREVKGIATSIPGVAIAVALMPPLCVTGYGVGLAITFDSVIGWRVASGGSLLFLTNLVAITFTAMIVFLAIKLSTAAVRTRAEEWEHSDPESAFILRLIERFPRLEHAREFRGLPIRLTLIVVPLIAIGIPLWQSFNKLQTEIFKQQKENQIKREITTIWQERFQFAPNGALRSTIDRVLVTEKDGKVEINMRVFDDSAYSPDEKTQFTELIAARLSRPVNSIALRLTEIPTTSVVDSLREIVSQPVEPSLSDLQAELSRKVDIALSGAPLPANARLLDRELVINRADHVKLNVTYICDQNLDEIARASVIDHVRSRLNTTTDINLERIPTTAGAIDFPRRSSTLPILGILQLDFVGRTLRENSSLLVTVSHRPRRGEASDLDEARFQAIVNYLESKWQIATSRITRIDGDTDDGVARLGFQLENQPVQVNQTPLEQP